MLEGIWKEIRADLQDFNPINVWDYQRKCVIQIGAAILLFKKDVQRGGS